MTRTPINSPDYQVPIDGFNQIVTGPPGSTPIYLSGLTSRTTDGTIVGTGDVAAQTRQILENMRLILRAAGADLEDVVAIRTYVLDIEAWPIMEPIWREFWGESWPASTLVEISRLFDDRQMIEMEAVAMVVR